MKNLEIEKCEECKYLRSYKSSSGSKTSFCAHPSKIQKIVLSTLDIDKTIHKECPLEEAENGF